VNAAIASSRRGEEDVDDISSRLNVYLLSLLKKDFLLNLRKLKISTNESDEKRVVVS
jgi:hypothetical protein